MTAEGGQLRHDSGEGETCMTFERPTRRQPSVVDGLYASLVKIAVKRGCIGS